MSVAGIGMDLVDVARARRILARFGERALRRFLTEGEREYVLRQPDPAPSFAARVAAKEAAYKALQSLPEMRGVGWQDLEVSRNAEGRPHLVMRGPAAGVSAEYSLLLSLTHTDGVAGAVAILSRNRP